MSTATVFDIMKELYASFDVDQQNAVLEAIANASTSTLALPVNDGSSTSIELALTVNEGSSISTHRESKVIAENLDQTWESIMPDQSRGPLIH